MIAVKKELTPAIQIVKNNLFIHHHQKQQYIPHSLQSIITCFIRGLTMLSQLLVLARWLY